MVPLFFYFLFDQEYGFSMYRCELLTAKTSLHVSPIIILNTSDIHTLTLHPAYRFILYLQGPIEWWMCYMHSNLLNTEPVSIQQLQISPLWIATIGYPSSDKTRTPLS